MPEHNAAESRSHFAAWALVSAPLVLGFDLTDDVRMKAAWPVISNEDVIEIDQTWVQDADWPSGRLLRQWQAPNVPTLTVRGTCGLNGCVDPNENCTKWAAEQQCDLNPTYMRTHCRRSCGTCEHNANFTSFIFEESSTPGVGVVRVGDNLCLDSHGQLPAGHSGSNVMHAIACVDGETGQQWHFNKSNGVIKSVANGLCLHASANWLWSGVPIVDLSSCDMTHPNERWTLHQNGTLSNGQYGCIEVSFDSGPPSTIWTKPMRGGRLALLAINGADQTQHITLNFNELKLGAAKWDAKDVWTGTSLGAVTEVARAVPAHDCVLIVLAPLTSTSLP
jgi:hypothetical protein